MITTHHHIQVGEGTGSKRSILMTTPPTPQEGRMARLMMHLQDKGRHSPPSNTSGARGIPFLITTLQQGEYMGEDAPSPM